MAAKPIDSNIRETVVAEWRTGAYSYQQLADRNGISKAKVGQLCKGIDKDLSAIVDAKVQYLCGLQNEDRRIVDAVDDVADERTKHIMFFNSAALRNVQEAMSAPCENQNDFKARAETINKGRETVLGKTPDVAVQVNNNNAPHKVQFEVIGGNLPSKAN
jgi:hypothetical protein